jgi:signal transduction histidine kinase
MSLRLGIRGKLVGLLTLVALLPLLTALGVAAVGGRRMRVHSQGRAIRAMGASRARLLSLSLVKDVEKVRLALCNSERICSFLAALDTHLDEATLRDLDARWAALPSDVSPMLEVLDNPVSRRLVALRREDRQFAEILVTDRFGQLVAATGRTSDFYQADETWWKGAFDAGKGVVYLPPVSFDESTGVWSLDVCVPIRSEGEVVGIAKAVLDVSRWIDSGQTMAMPAKLMLVRRDGVIVHGTDRVPLAGRVDSWEGEVAEGLVGWRVTDQGMIQGFAPVGLPESVGSDRLRGPEWSVVLYVPISEALGGVHRLILMGLGLGLALIATVFLVGLLLSEREIVRRVRRLAHATRAVARGDLSHRLLPEGRSRRLFGDDEIDDLAGDFNRMVEEVQRGHAELASASELKSGFIRVAGHELRTPVSYILATTGMLGDCEDVQRLRKAMESIGGKGRRLEEIIQAMFKLMPDAPYAGHLRREEVRVESLLEEVYSSCLPFAQRRGQRIEVASSTGVPDMRIDREKMRDVLENLVMNAVKFTPDGGVVHLRVGPELDGRVCFEVRDEGPGIPPGDLPHLFEPFFSGGDVMKHSTGRSGYQKRGMGLGLAVVRHFVDLHDGSVEVASGPSGSTFTVRIPAEPAK